LFALGFRKNEKTKKVIANYKITVTDTASNTILENESTEQTIGEDNNTGRGSVLSDILSDGQDVIVKIEITKWKVIPV